MPDRIFGPRTEVGTKIFYAKVEKAMLRVQPELIGNYDGTEAINGRELYLEGLIGALSVLEAMQERTRQGVDRAQESETIVVIQPRQEPQQSLSRVS